MNITTPIVSMKISDEFDRDEELTLEITDHWTGDTQSIYLTRNNAYDIMCHINKVFEKADGEPACQM